MPKSKRKGSKDTRVHCVTWGTGRPLCGAKSGKTASDPEKITCDACGRKAEDLVVADLENRRQESALAHLQEPRWWEKDQVDG